METFHDVEVLLPTDNNHRRRLRTARTILFCYEVKHGEFTRLSYRETLRTYVRTNWMLTKPFLLLVLNGYARFDRGLIVLF